MASTEHLIGDHAQRVQVNPNSCRRVVIVEYAKKNFGCEIAHRSKKSAGFIKRDRQPKIDEFN